MEQISINISRKEAEYIVDCLADEIYYYVKVSSQSSTKYHSRAMATELSALRDRILISINDKQ